MIKRLQGGYAAAWWVLGLVVAHADAATYRCTSGMNGASTYYSERPCPGVQGKMGMINGSSSRHGGGYEMRGHYSGSSNHSPSAAPGHLRYLSPACASLNDAMRTASTRGLKYQLQAELSEEYTRKCSIEDRAARDQFRQDESHERERQQHTLEQGRMEKEQAQQKARQCNAFRDTLVTRRKNLDHSIAADVQALRRAEEQFNARCLGH